LAAAATRLLATGLLAAAPVDADAPLESSP
jgi:hypothetical protein